MKKDDVSKHITVKYMLLKFYFINWTVTLTIVVFLDFSEISPGASEHCTAQLLLLDFWAHQYFQEQCLFLLQHTERKKCCLTLWMCCTKAMNHTPNME